MRTCEEEHCTIWKMCKKTTDFSKRLLDPGTVGATLSLVKCFNDQTQEAQADHEIKKCSYSTQKSATLDSPHLDCTTKGNVVHVADLFNSDGHQANTNLCIWITK